MCNCGGIETQDKYRAQDHINAVEKELQHIRVEYPRMYDAVNHLMLALHILLNALPIITHEDY